MTFTPTVADSTSAAPIKKFCGGCHEEKPITEFGFARGKKDGLQTRCRSCKATYYKENRSRLYPMIKAHGRAARKAARDFLLKYKQDHPCERCPESDPVALDFHHPDGEKEFAIANAVTLGKSIENLKKEIAKCHVLCSNCHRKFHAGRFVLASEARKG